MRFSIIIPIYNVEKYLRQCLASVLDQSFSDWEAVCVNDGSKDGSAAILGEFAEKDNRIRVVDQANAGLSAARNTGLRYATGDYVLFLDSDDWLEGNALEILSRNLDGEDMVCFSGRRYIEYEDRFLPADRLTARCYSSGMEYYNENALQHRDFAFVCVVLRAYKRSFLLDYDLRFTEGIYHEDNLFTPQACYYAQTIKVTDDSLYVYRVRENSITTTYDSKRMCDMMRIANELAAFFIPKSGFSKTVVYRAITHHYQAVLMNVSKSERESVYGLCDWNLYGKVSRTKPRHFVNYVLNRMSRFL